LDETGGLAVASARPAARTLAVVGPAAHGAWVAGTAAGVLGANLVAAAPLASIVFVILFVGLAGMTCRSAADAARAIAAGLLAAVPQVGAPGAIVAALACAALFRRGWPAMSWLLLVVLAAVTVASRVLPMTLLPGPAWPRRPRF
jgi:hypothetical protein